MRQTDRFMFFFGLNYFMSNWHPAQFEYRSIQFGCVERFKMYSKAMIFGNVEIALESANG